MTTIFVATTPDEVRNLFPWARASAASRTEDLELLLPMRRKGETRVVAASPAPEEDESELLAAAREALSGCAEGTSSDSQIQLLLGEEWQSDLVSALADQKPSFVIVPAPTISKDQSADEDWQTKLLENIDCDVLMLRDDSTDVREGVRFAVFVTDSADNETALDYAARLTEANSGTVTAVYVQPDISNESASIGRRQLDNMLQRIVRRSDRSVLKHRVVVTKSISEALRDFNASDFDLLLIGSRDLREIRRFLSANVTGNDGETGSIPAVAVLKRGESLSNRFVNRIGRAIRSVVPQLSREERINLATRIQDSSKWDFDFVLLISLATLIACFGLAENSGAVIVGAMLVAPLMTPIAGVGLGVAHANLYLTKVAFRTALRGFATAILIGAIFGLLVQMISGIGWLEPLLHKSTSMFSIRNGEPNATAVLRSADRFGERRCCGLCDGTSKSVFGSSRRGDCCGACPADCDIRHRVVSRRHHQRRRRVVAVCDKHGDNHSGNVTRLSSRRCEVSEGRPERSTLAKIRFAVAGRVVSDCDHRD